MKKPFLTKSKFLCGLQCHKYLWIMIHQPELIPPPDPAIQARFDEGYVVDRLAKHQFAGGISLATDDFMKNVRDTQAALAERKPLFEAGFMVGNISARADILAPSGKRKWDLFEVKSATGVKDVHLTDVAFQKFCYEKAGLKIHSCHLVHVNNAYVRRGELEPEQVLTRRDISRAVGKVLPGIPAAIDALTDMLGQKNCPDVDIGPHCGSPYECPLVGLCWEFLPRHNVFTLYRGGKKSRELYDAGIKSIGDIPAGVALTARQEIQRECVAGGKPHVDTPALRQFLNGLIYPLSFLDFETFGTVIPRFDFVSPYQNIPFQFSLHVQAAPGDKPSHVSFLAAGAEDPRPGFLAALRAALPKSGSILVYNRQFEAGILGELAKVFPEARVWIDAVRERFVDLYAPFGTFQYYHPDQGGSASLKAVLPALTGQGYKDFAIADGLTASRAFTRLAFGDPDGAACPEGDAAALRRDLERYCGRDTEGMVWIVAELGKFIS